MRKSDKIAVLAALMLLLTAVPVLAYFTAYSSTSGGWRVHTDWSTGLVEDVFDTERMFKQVHVENAAGSCDVYVRVRAFAPSGFELTYGWEQDAWYDGDDGWFYAAEPVPEDQATPPLDIRIASDGRTVHGFNVPVIYESVPAVYSADGSSYADFGQKAILG